MAQIRRRVRNLTKVQVHARIPVPKGFVLAPGVVSELVDNWIYGQDLPGAGEVTAIDWNIEGKRKGRVDKSSTSDTEVDQRGELRQGFIGRFWSGGTISSTYLKREVVKVGASEVQKRGGKDD